MQKADPLRRILFRVYSGILINQQKKYKGNLIGAILSGLITLAMLQRIFTEELSTHLVTLGVVGFICFIIHMKSKIIITAGGKRTTSLRWWQGFFLSSIFSLVYLFTPSYIISSLTLVCLQYPTRNISLMYATPLILSLIFPSTGMPFLAKYMTSMLDYFAYEEILETSNEDAIKMANEGKNFILAMQPHGVVSNMFMRFHYLMCMNHSQDACEFLVSSVSFIQLTFLKSKPTTIFI